MTDTETENLITKGRHRAILRAIQFGYADTDAEQIALGFEIVDGPTVDPDTGRFVSCFGYFSDASVQYTVEKLRAIGWTGQDLADLPRLLEAGELTPEVEIVVQHKEYRGEWRADVAFVNPIGGGLIHLKRPMDGAALKQFSERMRSKLRTVGVIPPPRSGGSNAARSTHPYAPGNASDVENDIPFITCAVEAEPHAMAHWQRWA